jgi:Flp pilus assembly protein TadG
MRVTRRIDPSDDRGVSAVIVAIALVAIFAMVVLVVDAGALLVKRRAMVKAADAAALAAAQTCLRDDGSAEAEADTFAALNASSAVAGGIEDGGCDGHYVTVRYTTQQDLYFAPVLGFGDSGTVAASATAAWGATATARAVPFVLVQGSFQSGNCSIPDIPKNTECNFWFDNGGGGAGGFGGAVFGSLNLNEWNWDGPCGSKDFPDNRHYAEAGGYDGADPLLLNYPEPTWVCEGDGLSDPIYVALSKNIGEIISFPIAESQVPVDGKFNIIGFTAVELVDVVRANSAGGGDSGTCTINRHFLANEAVDLDTVTGPGCPITVTGQEPNTLTTPTVTGCTEASTGGATGGGDTGGGGTGGSDPGPTVSCDGKYDYDSASHVLTWGGTPTDTQITVSYDWQVYGDCGAPATNDSGYCIRVKWVGHRFGNGPVTNGPDFGLDAIRLCDLKFAGSCPTSS